MVLLLWGEFPLGEGRSVTECRSLLSLSGGAGCGACWLGTANMLGVWATLNPAQALTPAPAGGELVYFSPG
jgi:hypothetical protein